MDEIEQINGLLRSMDDDALDELVARIASYRGNAPDSTSEMVTAWWDSLRWAVVLERIRRTYFGPRVTNPGEVVTDAAAMLDRDALRTLLGMGAYLDTVVADRTVNASVRFLQIAFRAVETEWLRRHDA